VENRQGEVDAEENPELQILHPVFPKVLPRVRPYLYNLNSYEVTCQYRDDDPASYFCVFALEISEFLLIDSLWHNPSVIVYASSRVDDEGNEYPLYYVFLVGDFLKEELDKFVVVY